MLRIRRRRGKGGGDNLGHEREDREKERKRLGTDTLYKKPGRKEIRLFDAAVCKKCFDREYKQGRRQGLLGFKIPKRKYREKRKGHVRDGKRGEGVSGACPRV